MSTNISMVCATDVGSVRKANQDCVAIFPEMNLVVLADGMGGHKAGEVASRIAITTLRDAIRDGLKLEAAVKQANLEVFDHAQKNEQCEGMGTTLVACQYDGLKATIANVGDSRLYRHRKGEYEQLTVDQTVAQQMKDVQESEKIKLLKIHKYEHVLTQALGVQLEVKPVMTHEVFQPGDIHLLCSDGLSGMLEDELMNQFLITHSDSLDACAQSLLAAALKRIANDNVSLALVRSG